MWVLFSSSDCSHSRTCACAEERCRPTIHATPAVPSIHTFFPSRTSNLVLTTTTTTTPTTTTTTITTNTGSWVKKAMQEAGFCSGSGFDWLPDMDFFDHRDPSRVATCNTVNELTLEALAMTAGLYFCCAACSRLFSTFSLFQLHISRILRLMSSDVARGERGQGEDGQTECPVPTIETITPTRPQKQSFFFARLVPETFVIPRAAMSLCMPTISHTHLTFMTHEMIWTSAPL